MRIEVDITWRQFVGLLIFILMMFVMALTFLDAVDWELENAGRRADRNQLYYEICVGEQR